MSNPNATTINRRSDNPRLELAHGDIKANWALPEKVDSELRQVGVITLLEFFRG